MIDSRYNLNYHAKSFKIMHDLTTRRSQNLFSESFFGQGGKGFTAPTESSEKTENSHCYGYEQTYQGG